MWRDGNRTGGNRRGAVASLSLRYGFVLAESLGAPARGDLIKERRRCTAPAETAARRGRGFGGKGRRREEQGQRRPRRARRSGVRSRRGLLVHAFEESR